MSPWTWSLQLVSAVTFCIYVFFSLCTWDIQNIQAIPLSLSDRETGQRTFKLRHCQRMLDYILGFLKAEMCLNL